MAHLTEYLNSVSTREKNKRLSSLLDRRYPISYEDEEDEFDPEDWPDEELDDPGCDDEDQLDIDQEEDRYHHYNRDRFYRDEESEEYTPLAFDPEDPFHDTEDDIDDNPFSPLDDEDVLSGRDQYTNGDCSCQSSNADNEMTDMTGVGPQMEPDFGVQNISSGQSMSSMEFGDQPGSTEPSVMDTADRLRAALQQIRPEEQEEEDLDAIDDETEDNFDDVEPHEEPDGDEKTVTINLNINVNKDGGINVNTGDKDENLYDLGLEDFDDEQDDEQDDEEFEAEDTDDDLGLEGEIEDSGEPETDELGLEDEFEEEPEDPDKQGAVRLVPGAHLVFKRQGEDGTFSEMWIYNLGEEGDKSASKVRKAILAGTDIPEADVESEDGSQTYHIWTAGNAQILKIEGLPN